MKLAFLGSIRPKLFLINIQNIFPWLFLIIYTSYSVLFLLRFNSLIALQKEETQTKHTINNFHWNFRWENFSLMLESAQKFCKDLL